MCTWFYGVLRKRVPSLLFVYAFEYAMTSLFVGLPIK
jgi:hypothetical protein